jgi:hypothetical protein
VIIKGLFILQEADNFSASPNDTNTSGYDAFLQLSQDRRITVQIVRRKAQLGEFSDFVEVLFDS